jgi:hypothetical protein
MDKPTEPTRETAGPQVGDTEWDQLRKLLLREDEASRGRIELILKSEYDQSWNHYRQLETTRSQYLGFLFAALFALAPILKVISELQVLGDYRYPAAALMGVAYATMTMFVFLVVRRNNDVLKYYFYAMRQIPRIFYGPHYARLMKLLDVNTIPDVAARTFRISRAAERLCLGAVLGLTSAMVALSAVPLLRPQVGWPKYLSFAIAMFTAAAVVILLRRIKRSPRSNRSWRRWAQASGEPGEAAP